MEHLLTVETLTNEDVMVLLNRAFELKKGVKVKQQDDIYAVNLFYENSTRTRTSFEKAEYALGYQVLPFEVATSSVQKGESLYDTVITMEAVGAKVAVIRHSENAYYQPLLAQLQEKGHSIHLVNGGDGSGQHPTQCLLDLMTIYEEFGHFEGLKVAIIGDIRNSRVARSNAHLLTQLGASVFFSGPDYWFDESLLIYGPYKPEEELLKDMDVVMLLRVQHERHSEGEDQALFTKDAYHEAYGINQKRYAEMKKTAIIMHPGPINRGVELAGELVEAPKSRFYRQIQNGVYVRMAVLEAVCGGK